MQRVRKCALPGYDESKWQDGMPEAIHYGLPKLVTTEQVTRFRKKWGPASDPRTPYEGNDDGCPGAWYRSDFAQSVLPYERTILKDGIADSLALNRTEDRLVLEAAAYLEAQRMRHRAHWDGVINE